MPRPRPRSTRAMIPLNGFTITSLHQTDFNLEDSQMVFSGDVFCESPDFQLTCDEFIVHLRKDMRGMSYGEAKGNVVITTVKEWQRLLAIPAMPGTLFTRPDQDNLILSGWPRIRYNGKETRGRHRRNTDDSRHRQPGQNARAQQDPLCRPLVGRETRASSRPIILSPWCQEIFVASSPMADEPDFEVVVHPLDGHTFWGEVVGLSGCVTQGRELHRGARAAGGCPRCLHRGPGGRRGGPALGGGLCPGPHGGGSRGVSSLPLGGRCGVPAPITMSSMPPTAGRASRCCSIRISSSTHRCARPPARRSASEGWGDL